jgi:hydroxypyruvate isomerase
MTVVTGFMDKRLHPAIQMGRIDVMRRAGFRRAARDDAGDGAAQHPDQPSGRLHAVDRGRLCRGGANSPGVKVLADLYHEQIQSGSDPDHETRWDEIGYIQFGDNPGRNEPGSGEINYANICRFLKAQGYAGVIGMEHGNSVKGARARD